MNVHKIIAFDVIRGQVLTPGMDIKIMPINVINGQILTSGIDIGTMPINAKSYIRYLHKQRTFPECMSIQFVYMQGINIKITPINTMHGQVLTQGIYINFIPINVIMVSIGTRNGR